ncbi:hypothetical protein FO519_007869 [Halicephalobus sp. NKZ332]|nr:hypothetical protein FO519_007869 [Halicephalobus sp. NKZ332]
MAANDALVQPNEQTKVEFGDAQFSNEDGVKVSPNAATTLFLDSEKLEYYRNEKKYRLIRWALFAAFWLIWVALIGSAIAIIVFSPRKKDDSKSGTTNTYEVFLPSLSDGPNGFERLKGQLHPLADLGVNTLLISPVFKYNSNAADNTDVEDYILNDSLGTKEELRDLIQAVHDAKMKIIADVPLKLISPRKSKNLDGFVKRTKDGDVLDLGNTKARNYLLNGIAETLLDIDGVSFDGAYIHEPSDSDVKIDGYNDFLAEAKEHTKDEEKVFPSNFIFIVAADYEKGKNINAKAIYDRITATSAKNAIEKLVEAASRVIDGNTTFTPVLSSADVPRFAKNFNNENLLKLVNGLRLFAFPHSHILYGEEYGETCNDVPSLCKYPNLDYHSLAHNATIPAFGDGLRESARKIAVLHPTLISNSSIILKNSITRESIDGHHYSFVFNEGNTTKSIIYKDIVPAQFTGNLKNVGIDGLESDYSEKSENFGPYEYKVLKFLKVD